MKDEIEKVIDPPSNNLTTSPSCINQATVQFQQTMDSKVPITPDGSLPENTDFLTPHDPPKPTLQYPIKSHINQTSVVNSESDLTKSDMSVSQEETEHRKSVQNKPMIEWSKEDVCFWISSIFSELSTETPSNLSELIKMNSITGKVLHTMTNDELKEVFKFPFGVTKMMMNDIEKNNTQGFIGPFNSKKEDIYSIELIWKGHPSNEFQ